MEDKKVESIPLPDEAWTSPAMQNLTSPNFTPPTVQGAFPPKKVQSSAACCLANKSIPTPSESSLTDDDCVIIYSSHPPLPPVPPPQSPPPSPPRAEAEDERNLNCQTNKDLFKMDLLSVSF